MANCNIARLVGTAPGCASAVRDSYAGEFTAIAFGIEQLASLVGGGRASRERRLRIRMLASVFRALAAMRG